MAIHKQVNFVRLGVGEKDVPGIFCLLCTQPSGATGRVSDARRRGLVEVIDTTLPRVIVIDPVPLYRHALETHLREAGFVATAVNVGDPGQVDQAHIVILGLMSRSAWQALSELHVRVPSLPIVAVVTEDSPALHHLARNAGASCVLLRQASADEIVPVARMALAGRTIIPSSAIKRDNGLHHRRGGHSVSQDEVQWLRAIALGHKIKDLADAFGYSERSMHRRLGVLYRKLGAQDLLHALIYMERWGLLEEGRVPTPSCNVTHHL